MVQLYNIDEDPTEKNDVSSEFPKVVNVMLTKLADYYVRLCILYHFMDNLIGPNISTGPFSDVLVRNSMTRSGSDWSVVGPEAEFHQLAFLGRTSRTTISRLRSTV